MAVAGVKAPERSSMSPEARALLEKLPILSFLSPESRKLVLDRFVPETFSFGNVIVREGDTAEALREDIRQTVVPPAVEQRLSESIAKLPKPEKPWWKRFIGRQK